MSVGGGGGGILILNVIIIKILFNIFSLKT